MIQQRIDTSDIPSGKTTTVARVQNWQWVELEVLIVDRRQYQILVDGTLITRVDGIGSPLSQIIRLKSNGQSDVQIFAFDRTDFSVWEEGLKNIEVNP